MQRKLCTNGATGIVDQLQLSLVQYINTARK